MNLKKNLLFLVLIVNTFIINAQTLYYGDIETKEIKISVTLSQDGIYVKDTNSNIEVFMRPCAEPSPNGDCTFISDIEACFILFSDNFKSIMVKLRKKLEFYELVSIDNNNTIYSTNSRESREINSNQYSENDKITIEYLLKNEQDILNRLEREKSLFSKSLLNYKHLELINQSKQRIENYQQRLKQFQ